MYKKNRRIKHSRTSYFAILTRLADTELEPTTSWEWNVNELRSLKQMGA
jgi:hypothetical protein